MQAQIINQFGSPDVFEGADIPVPQVIPKHVLIRVMATSVNPVDLKIRQGVPAYANVAPDLPAVLHGDVAGVVEAIGDGVSTFRPGDEVYACPGGVKGFGGALAEYMLVDVDLVAHKPKSLAMTAAAALPLISITAWEAIIERAKVQPGQRVLVYGATGGVGHIGLQLAKWAGAKVYALVSSEEKEAIARKLGADFTINYRLQTVEDFVAEHTDGQGFDVVFDTVGNDNLQNAFKAAKLNGTVVSIVSTSKQDLTLLHTKGLTLHLVYRLIPIIYGVGRVRQGEILTQVAQLVDAGQVHPLLDTRVFNFSEVAQAHQRAESGQALGKVVLQQG
ncbi:zinc-dependent alcohol dehydrogenase family protein [Scytonema sp. NUACC26]|uniref:zinc-dependent alcohol dehydrogenase family protein n=1 Tax=Scytonema sp. NUACC26 TaxID=3140176 RepID=UPI0034DCC311